MFTDLFNYIKSIACGSSDSEASDANNSNGSGKRGSSPSIMIEMRKAKKLITIEGNISSGKSYCVDKLREVYANDDSVAILLEPLTIWQSIKDEEGQDMITKFYGDIPKYSFAFQMMAYISRLVALKEALANPAVKVVITERSLLTDKNVFAKMLFEDKKMESVEHQIYLKWFDHFIQELPSHDIIYIRTDPEVAYKRLQQRARQGESASLEYLKQVHSAHEEWLSASDEATMIDGNVDKDSDYAAWTYVATYVKQIVDEQDKQ